MTGIIKTRVITVTLDAAPPEISPFRRALESTTADCGWAAFARSILSEAGFYDDFRVEFHTHWTVAGHHIRAQIDNDGLLIALLRKVLPAYQGEGLTLYRGENLDRLKAGRTGLCWTPIIETARMFARGLNATRSGGALLQCSVPASAIIAGPSDHSRYLDESEYTVDSTLLSEITTLEAYCSSDR